MTLAFILLHAPLALAMRQFPDLATAHALGVFLLGLIWSVQGRIYHLVYVTAYITGAEILWRSTEAAVFWEFGKYSVTFLLILALVRRGNLAQVKALPVVFFLLLLPSILSSPTLDRQAISFNLSGPLALSICSVFFCVFPLTTDHLQRILIAILSPVVGLATLASSSTIISSQITFGNRSNFVASGGFGPNQVSSMLGLGVIVALMLASHSRLRRNRVSRLIVFALAIWLTVQCLLTFARGGFLTAVGALLPAVVILLRDRRRRFAVPVLGAVFLLVLAYKVIPELNDFTEGAFGERYSNFHTTGRVEIIEADLIAFKENPLFGAGLYQSKEYHRLTFRFSSAHTEYSRMLAEHGLFGLCAVILLGILSLQRYQRKLPPIRKAYVVCFTTWALLFMCHAAMRLVAPSYLFGLAGAAMVSPVFRRRGTRRLSQSF